MGKWNAAGTNHYGGDGGRLGALGESVFTTSHTVGPFRHEEQSMLDHFGSALRTLPSVVLFQI